jgi:chaperonin GroES
LDLILPDNQKFVDINLKLETILSSDNLADELTEEQRQHIAGKVVEGYVIDRNSRSEWEDRMESAIKLALQITEKKTFPWQNASNVKFPLVTIAALQFSSRAYPALITDNRVVKMRVIGSDQDGSKASRAERISQHMSYQVLEEDESWEEETDKLLITIPIMGCAYKKSYFDSSLGHNVSSCINPFDLVMDYYSRSVDTASRVTHTIYRTPNEIKERMREGKWLEFDISHTEHSSDSIEETRKEIRGTKEGQNDPSASQIILEQHCWLDLDGDDYSEPYVVTVHKATGKLLRIIRRFEQQDITYRKDRIVKIKAHNYFTQYGFIPSPDGGCYYLGFGVLLGPVNESVNTIINQLVDAGTLSNLQSGYLGRGIRLKGGNATFRPGEWKKVENTGDDLRKNIFPLPVREPSQVLFQLLGLLISYGERIGSVSDMMVGENPGQNQPATTSMAVLEQGLKVFSGIFKRIHRSLKEEFRKLFTLNQKFLQLEEYFEVLDTGDQEKVTLTDYQEGDPKDVRPASDPNMIADSQLLMQAEAISQRSMTVSGYNPVEVEKLYLRAMKIPNADLLYPLNEEGKPAIEPPPDKELQTTLAELEIEKERLGLDRTTQSIELEMKFAKLEAEIEEIETRSILNLAKAEAAEEGIQLDQYKAKLETLKEHRETIKQKIEGNEWNGKHGGSSRKRRRYSNT